MPNKQTYLIDSLLSLSIQDCKINFSEFMSAVLIARWRGGSNFANLVEKVQAKVNVARGQVVSNLFFLLTFLVLLSSSSTLFRYLKCDVFKIPSVDRVNDVAKEKYLFVDYSVNCDSKRYSSHIPFAVC